MFVLVKRPEQSKSMVYVSPLIALVLTLVSGVLLFAVFPFQAFYQPAMYGLIVVIGALVGAALPTAVILLYRLVRGEEGMGWGDVKYLAAIGSVVGLRGVVGVLVVASVVGALVGLGLIAAGKGSGKTALPFGTFLALAVILWLYAPASWLAWSPL